MCTLAYVSAYGAEHSEEITARAVAWNTSHPERRSVIRSTWRKKNPEACSAYTRNRRAREKGNGGTHTSSDIQAQYRRQNGRCFYCKTKVRDDYHVDHVVPVAAGGSNGPENLVVACPPCNQTKAGKLHFAGMLL